MSAAGERQTRRAVAARLREADAQRLRPARWTNEAEEI